MVRLNIIDKQYVYFNEYTIELKYNTIASTFSFKIQKDILDNLLGYPRCEIIKDEFPILTGTIIVPQLKVTSKPELISISGYSVPGVLEDIPIPTDLYPLQSDNLNLEEIAEKYTNPFNVNIAYTQNVEKDMKKKYTKVVADESETIKSFLTKLASERGIILTHNELGSILFTRVEVDKLTPVGVFIEGDAGINAMTLDINGQALHSSITVLKQASVNNPDAGQFTIDNPYCDIYRPNTLIHDSGDIFDIEKAARKALSDELTAIKLTINTTKFIKPGNIIQVKSESLKLNSITDFFVEETIINGNVKDETYTLICVLKDVYSDNEVKRLIN